MRRFILIYGNFQDNIQHAAEGLTHCSGEVYAKGFHPPLGVLFYSMVDFRNHVRDREDISYFHIQMIDEEAS